MQPGLGGRGRSIRGLPELVYSYDGQEFLYTSGSI